MMPVMLSAWVTFDFCISIFFLKPFDLFMITSKEDICDFFIHVYMQFPSRLYC
jgi:hypothetical protein